MHVRYLSDARQMPGTRCRRGPGKGQSRCHPWQGSPRWSGCSPVGHGGRLRWMSDECQMDVGGVSSRATGTTGNAMESSSSSVRSRPAASIKASTSSLTAHHHHHVSAPCARCVGVQVGVPRSRARRTARNQGLRPSCTKGCRDEERKVGCSTRCGAVVSLCGSGGGAGCWGDEGGD